MKKRLLSAALALAMVLTMLPLSVAPAFAAATPPSPPSTGTVTNITWDEFTGDFAPTAVTYYAAGSTYQGYTIQTSGWYSAVMRNAAGANVCYFAPEATGVITAAIPSTGWANGNSGTLYPSVTMAAERGATSVTLLNSDTLDVNKATAYSMSINLNGKVLNVISSGTANKLTQLTLTDTAATGSASGNINVTNRSFTLNNGNTNGTYPVSASSLNLTLTNTQTTGTAWGTGALTVNNYGGTLGSITTKNAKGNITVNGGNVTLISLGSLGSGPDDMDNRAGGSVKLSSRAKVGNVTIVGTGSLSMSGMSEVTGAVSLYGGGTKNNTAGTVPTWNGTTVTIDGASTVNGGISQYSGDSAGRHSITVSNRSTVGSITLNLGGSNTVKISDSTVTSGVKMAHGSLTVTNSSIGGITAAKPESWDTTTDGLSITVGTRNQADTSNTGNIVREADNPIIPALTINGGTVGTITDDNGKKVNEAFSIELWGGETGTRIPQAFLKGGLSEGYLIQKAGSWLYTTDFQVVIDNHSAPTNAGAYRVNDDTAINPGSQKVRFLYTSGDTDALAELYITKGTYVKLPTKVNNTTVQYWHQLDSGDKTEEALEAGKSYLFPTGSDPINLSVQLAPNTTNRVIGVEAKDNDPGNTPIGCTLNGTTINLSGAVNTTGNTATITVTFAMNDGTTRTATVGWATDGTITVSRVSGDGVVIPTRHSNTVQVYNVSYTFNGSGLRGKVSGISVTTNLNSVAISVPNASAGMSGAFVELGKDLRAELIDVTKSNVNFSSADGVKMALNALIAGQTESSVQGIVNQARNAMVAYDNRAKVDDVNTHKVTDAKYTAYRYVVLTPYLEISSSNPTTTTGTAANPILTLNITLKYRYTVTDGTDTAYKDIVNGVKTDWEQTGNLNVTGDYGKVDIKLAMPSNLAFVESSKSYAHHNGYVYTMTWAGNAATISNVNGFSPFVINNTKPAVTITEQSGYGFDNLQTAVDAVKDGQNIVMHENFTGSINLTGIARKFTIKSENPNKVTVNLTGVNGASTTYDFVSSSNEYTIQLAANTLTPSGNVAISVVSVANGYARVSASSVKPGSVVTITTVPNAGYAATTPSVRYSTKTAASNVLSVTAAGANTWNFTVPADATGVTVTPGFVRITTTNVPFTDVSSTAWYYTGVEYCYNTVRGSARLMQGMNDANTVFSPNSGFTRAQVVQILWNMKGRPAPRNTYNRFSDISSIHYAYNAMLWAVQNGYAEGYPDGTFRPNQYVTRQEMAVFLWRAAGKPTGYNTLNLNNYNDGNQVYDWAQPAMRWAVATGVLSGQGSVAVGRYLAPRAVAYRSEVAVTVMNFDKLAVFR